MPFLNISSSVIFLFIVFLDFAFSLPMPFLITIIASHLLLQISNLLYFLLLRLHVRRVKISSS
jgi:hypothetical protein